MTWDLLKDKLVFIVTSPYFWVKNITNIFQTKSQDDPVSNTNMGFIREFMFWRRNSKQYLEEFSIIEQHRGFLTLFNTQKLNLSDLTPANCVAIHHLTEHKLKQVLLNKYNLKNLKFTFFAEKQQEILAKYKEFERHVIEIEIQLIKKKIIEYEGHKEVEITKLVTKYAKEKEELEERIKEERQNLVKEIDQKNKEIAKLREKLDVTEINLASTEMKFEQLKKSYMSQKGSLTNAKEHVEELNKQIEQLKHSLTKLKGADDALAALRNEADGYKLQVQQKEARCAELIKKNNQLVRDNQGLTENIELLNTQLKQQNNKLLQVQRENKENLEKAKVYYNLLENRLNKTNAQLEELRTKYDAISKIAAASTHGAADYVANAETEIKKTLNCLQPLIRSTEKRVDSINTAITDLQRAQDQIFTVTQKQYAAEGKILFFNKERELLINNLETKLAASQAANARPKLQEEIKFLENEIKQVEDETKNATEFLQEQMIEVKNANNAMLNLNEHLNNLVMRSDADLKEIQMHYNRAKNMCLELTKVTSGVANEKAQAEIESIIQKETANANNMRKALQTNTRTEAERFQRLKEIAMKNTKEIISTPNKPKPTIKNEPKPAIKNEPKPAIKKEPSLVEQVAQDLPKANIVVEEPFVESHKVVD